MRRAIYLHVIRLSSGQCKYINDFPFSCVDYLLQGSVVPRVNFFVCSLCDTNSSSDAVTRGPSAHDGPPVGETTCKLFSSMEREQLGLQTFYYPWGCRTW